MPWVTAVDMPQSCQHRTVRATESREEAHYQGGIREAPRAIPPAPLRGAPARHARGPRGRGARRPQRVLRVSAGEEAATRARLDEQSPGDAARRVLGVG